MTKRELNLAWERNEKRIRDLKAVLLEAYTERMELRLVAWEKTDFSREERMEKQND